VKDQRWCKFSVTKTPEGDKLTRKVLAFLPNAEKKAAAAAAVQAMMNAMASDPKKKSDEGKLKSLLQKVK
jgi:hypothetical protein